MATRRLRLIEMEEPMPETAEKPLRIAIATQDMAWLNAHFGSARTFAIYDVTPTAATFVEAIGFDDVADETGQHAGIDDRITPKVDALAGCALLFVLAIGGPAAAKVVRANIHPIKLKSPEPIGDVVARVQTMLADAPPPWLRKIVGRPADRSMSFLDEEVA